MSSARRGWLTGALVVALAAAAGYLATCALYPARLLPKRAEVPDLRGVRGEEAVTQLAALDLRGRMLDDVADALVQPGEVAWQSPAAGTSLPAGAIVRLAVSGGVPRVSVPDLVELDLELARRVLDAAGLRVGTVDSTADLAEPGTVLRIRPGEGTAIGRGAAIDLTVSRGIADLRMPPVTGLTVSEARERLASVGLRIGAVTQTFNGKAGTVQGQFPAAGTMVTKDQLVRLTISGALP